MKRMPVSRAHWAAFYQKIYCKTGRESAAHLASWYQLLDLVDEGAE